MRLITVQDTMYLVRGTVSANTEIGYEELKKQWNAEAILRNGDTLYLCNAVIDAEWKEINN